MTVPEALPLRDLLAGATPVSVAWTVDADIGPVGRRRGRLLLTGDPIRPVRSRGEAVVDLSWGEIRDPVTSTLRGRAAW